jgi:hypothetical protein
MRRCAAMGLVTLGLLATGCRPRLFQMSVHPFVEAAEAPADVTGRWISEDGDELVFSRAGENLWRVAVREAKSADEPVSGDEPTGTLVRLGLLDGTLYWDMSADEVASAGALTEEHLLKLHSVARLHVGEETMEVAFLDPGWMSEALADGRVDLAHFLEGEGRDRAAVLTASTTELQAFLEDYGSSPEVFGEPELYRRVE